MGTDARRCKRRRESWQEEYAWSSRSKNSGWYWEQERSRRDDRVRWWRGGHAAVAVVAPTAAEVVAAQAAAGAEAAAAAALVADEPATETGPRAFAWALSGAKQVWESLTHGHVQYEARVVQPKGASGPLPAELPMAFYLTGLGQSDGMLESLARDMTDVAPEPFLLVSPLRPKGGWWFIDSCSGFGWIRGEFQEPVVKRYTAWMEAMVRRPGVDARRVGLFGFSAGAYAVAEILAAGVDIDLCGVGLGGVHGHGQWDLSEVPAAHARGARWKFDAFLQRLRRHQGCRWIEATHGFTDKESKWEDACKIIEVVDARQAELKLPRVSKRKLQPEQQDQTPSKKRNKSHHSYFGAAFLRPEFLQALLGGELPEPDKVGAASDSAQQWPKRARRLHEAETAERATGGLVQRPPQEVTHLQSAAAAPGTDSRAAAPTFEWDAGSSGKRRWRRYSNEVQETIARAFAEQRGRGKLELSIEGFAYTVDFDTMRQVAMHSGYERTIRASPG